MTNNTTAISVSADFNMNSLMSILKDTKATVIIINNGTPMDMSNIFDTTATEVEVNKKHVFNHHAYYSTTLNKILSSHNIKVREKTGCGRGQISISAYRELVAQLERKEVSTRRIKFLFNALDEAGYKEEGRGLKNDIIFEVLDYIKENDFASHANVTQYHKAKNQNDLDNLVDRLKKLILTNDFCEKFHEFLREDEVAYATFELAEEKATA